MSINEAEMRKSVAEWIKAAFASARDEEVIALAAGDEGTSLIVLPHAGYAAIAGCWMDRAQREQFLGDGPAFHVLSLPIDFTLAERRDQMTGVYRDDWDDYVESIAADTAPRLRAELYGEAADLEAAIDEVIDGLTAAELNDDLDAVEAASASGHSPGM